MMNWIPGAVLGSVLGVSTLVGTYASVAGTGLQQPTNEPLSIREGTPRGHAGTSYFATTGRRGMVGGGLFGGK